MAFGMALVILAFGYLANDSVINLVHKVASYLLDPIQLCFIFGMFTRLKVRDRWMLGGGGKLIYNVGCVIWVVREDGLNFG